MGALALLAACACSPAASARDADSQAEAPPEGETPVPALEDYGPAPELENEVWLNTDRPLRLRDLRGKVVLLEMWTFG